MRGAMKGIVAQIPAADRDFTLADKVETWAAQTDARVIVYSILSTAPRPILRPYQDSQSATSSVDEGSNDSIAIAARETLKQTSGTVKRNGTGFAEVAAPVGNDYVVALSASLHDPLSNVETVQRRLVEAGVLALALALAVGYGAAFLFARRIRRLETAAERIAAGRFGQPLVDRSHDHPRR